MALSGSVATSAYTTTDYGASDGTRTVVLSWTATQNINNNTSTISWTLKGGGTFEWNVNVSELRVKIDGTEVYYRAHTTHTKCYPDTVLASGSKTITHNNDGTREVTMSVEAGIYSWAINKSGSKTFTLNTIPRATTINSLSCSTSYFNGTLTYKYTPQTASYYNRCNISLNVNGTYDAIKTLNLGKKTAAQQTGTVTLSSDELSVIYAKLPTTTKGTLRFTWRTYSDSDYKTQVGSAGYKEITLTIPSTITPSIGQVLLNPINITTEDGTSRNVLVQGKNKLEIKVSECLAGSGSTIASYTFSGPSIATTTKSSSNDNYTFTSGAISDTGTLTYTVKLIDKRGRSATKTATVVCHPYDSPSFLKFSVSRCDVNGNIDNNGTHAIYSLTVDYADVNSTNKSTVSIYYKKNTSSSWTACANALTNSTTKSVSATITDTDGEVVTFDLASTYLIYAIVVDNYGSKVESSTVTIFSSERIFNIRKNGTGIAFGKMAESNNLFESKWNAKFDGDVEIVGDVLVPDNGGPIINGYSVSTLGLGTLIQSGDDLNNYITAGTFRSTGQTISETLINTPHTGSGFKLVVECLGNTTYLRQIVIPRWTSCKYYIRYYGNGTWYDWQEFSADDTTDYLPLSGGTLTGKLTLDTNLYYASGNTAGLDCKNSDIINANAIYFADASNSAGEAINFYRDDGYWDTLYAYGGALKFHPNRATSTALGGYTIYNSSNFRRGTCTLNSTSSVTVTFSSAFGGTPTVILTPLTTTAGVIPGKVTSVNSSGFSAVIGGSAVSEAKFAYLAMYY